MIGRLVITLLLAVPAAAEAPAPTLAWFSGEWAGTGIMFGRASQVSLSVTPALDGTATALTYRASVAASANQPAFRFEGRGTYRVAPDGKVTGNWADSRGHFHPLAGRVQGSSMSVSWGEPRTELGHSTYRLEEGGGLVVVDSALANGTAREFATARYRRAGSPQSQQPPEI